MALSLPLGQKSPPYVAAFRAYFEQRGYQVVEIRVTDAFPALARRLIPNKALIQSPLEARIRSYIAYGNQVRAHFDDDSILSVATVHQVVRGRHHLALDAASNYRKVVYLLHQFKRQEEIDLLRSVYGQLFFQVSIYSRRGARVDHLSRRLAQSHNSADTNRYRASAEEIIQQDENERDEPHGQRVGKIFHHADVIFNLDTQKPDDQVRRFCELIFSSNTISPTKAEFGMFAAKAAALRTLDLSRQVGAAIFSQESEVIALGANEVPKGNGGSYWCDGAFDDREYVRGFDSNQRRKREILSELANILAPGRDVDDLMSDPGIRDSQFMDALEYGRIVHAEMSALSDASRLGRSLAGSILYCTTFPCHMCVKHIVASGVAKVVFLEPYPKSLAAELHSDSIRIEGGDRGRYQDYPAVEFEHFSGITPRRYQELFERGSRKDKSGRLQAYADARPRPFIDVKAPFYAELEKLALNRIQEEAESFFGDEPEARR